MSSSIPRPNEGDIDIGTATFAACWVLTAFVGVALLFRYGVKIWIRWMIPQVSAPERVWGYEDVLFLIAYGCDVTHMSMIQTSASWGLGRHYFYLNEEQRTHAMKWDFVSQPIAVASAMISRTGMMWFLATCFAASDRRIRLSVTVCAIVQVVVNMVTIVQIIVQCGPNPYRPTDRVQYFHYMWTALPADGSVKCQSPAVQTTVGFVQGGFNSFIDFFLGVLAAVELWQFFLRTLHREPNVSFWYQFRKINSTVRSRRIWQTLTLSGPLILSGAASIVKTYKLKSLGERLDFTYNIVSFVLWVKIENYSILLASCAPVARIFLRTIVDQRRKGRPHGYWSRSRSATKENNTDDTELKNRGKDPLESSMGAPWEHDEERTSYPWGLHKRCESRVSKEHNAPQPANDGQVTVKTDIIVHVDDNHSTSSGDARLLPHGGEPQPIEEMC